MKTRIGTLAAVVAMIGIVVFGNRASAQPATESFIDRNSNVVGPTIAGQYRGDLGMQDNEPSCGLNPILPRNIVCAWNASGGSNDPAGPADTAIRTGESTDGGKTFFSRYINGTNINPQTSIGVQFMADPVTLCFPGGCAVIFIGADRLVTGGGTGGGIYAQLMPDMNTEGVTRKGFKTTIDQVFRTTGDHFADKVHAIYMLDEQNPGTVEVTMEVEKPDGSIETITRFWPKARILFSFAYFNSSKQDIELLSLYTDDYFGRMSNAKQVAVTSGRDQGVSVLANDNVVAYTFRRFKDEDETDAIMGALSTNWGRTIGKPFVIVDDICSYDVRTEPNPNAPDRAASRVSNFPWGAQNGEFMIVVFAERKRNADGGCLTSFDEPTDSRIKMVWSGDDGKNWDGPVEVAPNPDHGFQFFPVIDCTLSVCQVGWQDSKRDTERVREFLEETRGDAIALAALDAFLNFPILADFNFNTGPNTVMRFTRTADPYTTKVVFIDGVAVPTAPAVRVSRYRRGLFNGELVEKQADRWNIPAYRSGISPFMGDYTGMTSVHQRAIVDLADPEAPPVWVDNSSIDPSNPGKAPEFWMSFVSSRNVTGHVIKAHMSDPLPYTKTPEPAASVTDPAIPATAPEAGQEILTAESVEDFNPGAGFCVPVPNPGPGVVFPALNNRTKDFDIYGALIRSEGTAYSLNPSKTQNIQRSYTIVAENESDQPKTYKFVIVNQPLGFPDTARASWDQLPFDPADPTFPTAVPNTVETLTVGPQSSEATAAFVVSLTDINPVVINVFEVVDPDDPATDVLINVITVNGTVESGPFLNVDGSLNDFEIHNPVIYTPDEFNPDEFNPDEYNPDEFNPALYTPDEFNPDEFNPDEFNPDEFNPDEFNPDEFNPDEFNPDEFNPDEFNPDEFNSPLTDPATFHNPEIADPELGDITGPVVKLDINYGVENIGNTFTPYAIDFAVTDPELIALLLGGEVVTQLIVWQDKKIEDVQFCVRRIISENHVIATVNNPDLIGFNIPTIDDNRNGIVTVVIGPGDIMQFTLRFIAPLATMEAIAPLITSETISHVVGSIVANTGSDTLIADEELLINDVGPPIIVGPPDDDTVTYEATGPSGAATPTDLVTASKGGVNVPVDCTPALGSTIPLDIDNAPAGPTPMSCSATASNGVTATLDFLVSVLDRAAPVIDPGSVPENQTVEATSAAGASAAFGTPMATDANGVDAMVDVACDPLSGSNFPFVSPGPTTTTVTCTATDDSGNTDSVSFDVTVQDTAPPDLVGMLVDFSVEADQIGGANVAYAPPTAVDIVDPAPTVGCSPAPGGFFALGPNLLTCQAFDASGNSSGAVATVTVVDTVAPVLHDVPADMVIEATGPDGAVAEYTPPTAFDFDFELGVSCVPGSGSTFPLGTTSVTCTSAPDPGLNTASASFDITVQDTTPPVLTVPDDFFVVLTDVSGVIVNYVVTANDLADPSPDINCAPASGSLFPPGTTTVTCSATDSSSNSSADSTFDVTAGFGGGDSLSSNKKSVKAGAVIGYTWEWTNAAGDRVDVGEGNQDVEARAGNCPSMSPDVLDEDPGASGIRISADLINLFNWQTVDQFGDPLDPDTYCFSVINLLTGQIQETESRVRR